MKVDGRASSPQGSLLWRSESDRWTVGFSLFERAEAIVVPDRLEGKVSNKQHYADYCTSSLKRLDCADWPAMGDTVYERTVNERV